jgi:glycerol uptake facilitator-like aquaporin
MPLGKRATAEFIGTFWLVFGGCGTAVLAAAFPAVGVGLLGVSLAFGLTVLTMAYAIGHLSGLPARRDTELIHLIGIPVTNLSVNPARSTGPAVFVGRWALAQLWLFWVAPIIGAAIAGFAYPAIAEEPLVRVERRVVETV